MPIDNRAMHDLPMSTETLSQLSFVKTALSTRHGAYTVIGRCTLQPWVLHTYFANRSSDPPTGSRGAYIYIVMEGWSLEPTGIGFITIHESSALSAKAHIRVWLGTRLSAMRKIVQHSMESNLRFCFFLPSFLSFCLLFSSPFRHSFDSQNPAIRFFSSSSFLVYL